MPHEHFDPRRHPHWTPPQVKRAEKHIVTKKVSFLLVVLIEPTTGGGIEVGWAEDRGIPVLTICPRSKLEVRLISRLVQGCSTMLEPFDDWDDAVDAAERIVRRFIENPVVPEEPEDDEDFAAMFLEDHAA